MAVSKHNIVQNHMLHDSEWSLFFFGRGLRALFLFPSFFFCHSIHYQILCIIRLFLETTIECSGFGHMCILDCISAKVQKINIPKLCTIPT